MRIDRTAKEVQVMMSEVRNHVEHLYIQFNALALGHLTPSIMALQDLKSLLLSITTKLTRTLRLPGNLDELWSFNKFLTCSSTTEDNKLLIILSILLLDAQDTHSIYKVHNLSAFMTNQTDSIIINGCSMFAQYDYAQRKLILSS